MRALDPGRYAEDASVLAVLAAAGLPGAGRGVRLGLRAGDRLQRPPGWSDNAEKFWRARRQAGEGAPSGSCPSDAAGSINATGVAGHARNADRRARRRGRSSC